MRLLNHLSIQSKLLLALLLTSILSILITGYIGYSSGRTALTNKIFDQLVGLRTAKAEEVRSYFGFVQNHVLTMSESPLAVDAVKEFKAAYQKLNNQALPAPQLAAVDRYYSDIFVPDLAQRLEEGTPAAEVYVPQTPNARYLQYHYIAKNDLALGKKDEIDNAGDGSEYSQVHQKYHPLFKSIAEKFKYKDVYLVDADTGNVIYSLEKEPDFGTNLRSGPFAGTNLAAAVDEANKSRDPNFVTVTDFATYRPSLNAPSAFIATTVFDNAKFIGVLVFQAPADEITRILTANAQWEKVGLGKTGAISLIGSDYTLRSLPRPYVENRDKYFETLGNAGLPPEQVDYIRRLGTPVTVLPARTTAVEKALAGREGAEIFRNFRGIPVLGAYQPIQFGNFNWALVALMDVEEAFAPVNQLVRRILVSSAILIPLVALFSYWLARLFVKPIERLIAATRRIAAGETDVEVKMKSNDELGELARSFNQMAYSLHQNELAIEQKDRENDRLLLNILPPSIANRLKNGEQQIADTFSNISVLYAEVEGFNELSANLPANEAIVLLNDLVGAFDEALETYGVEKVKTVGNAYIATCGLSVPRVDHSKRMMDYAIEMLNIVQRFNQQYNTSLGLDIGMDSGAVVAGIVGKSKFIYDVLGDTLNTARAIHSSPDRNIIQVTQPVHAVLHDLHPFERGKDVAIKGKGMIPVWAIKPLSSDLSDHHHDNGAVLSTSGQL
ncbi:adenylate/guanylate cyclase domain-containing protein [Leptolyngbya ohadii]|uniref:adenylate/guanylate cyclase domain-containing protein n=1 Tax=Leptolyngbya ohadii TaxID=1962290 RepID=UPI000B599A4C|nr:adenylate/guanylate cyclase domain-containing protein [Leptolyngbya ohadii]